VALAFGLWVESLSTPFKIRGGGFGFSICKGVSKAGREDSKPCTVYEEILLRDQVATLT
jgi:hypothetical protein